MPRQLPVRGWLGLTSMAVLVGLGAMLFKGCDDSDYDLVAIPVTSTPVVVTSVSPNTGPAAGGSTVTITGANFEPGNQTVTFGGNAATILTSDTSTMDVRTPAGTGTVPITITTTNNGTVTVGNAFTFVAVGSAPTLTSIAPDNGPESGGTEVTLTGSNFSVATGATIGGQALLNFVVVDDQTITGETAALTTASAPTSVPVVVQSPNGNSTNTVNFTYTSSVVASRVSPNQGPEAGGTTVRVFGRNFIDSTNAIKVTDVQFGGASASSFSVVSANELTAVTAAKPIGPADVKVVGTPDFGESSIRLGFTFGPVFKDPASTDRTSVAGVLSSSRVAAGDLAPVVSNVVAATLPGTSNVAVLVGGSSSTPGPFTSPTDVLWTQLNGIRNPDLVVLESDGDLAIFFDVSSTAAFGSSVAVIGTTTIAPTDSIDLATADFDGNGLLDIAMAHRDLNLIELVTNSGGGTAGSFTSATLIDLTTIPGFQPNPRPIRIVGADRKGPALLGLNEDQDKTTIDHLPKQFRRDLNRAGGADLIVLNENRTINLLLGAGNLTFTGSTVAPFVANDVPLDMAVTDFNSDGRLDVIVLTNQRITVLQGGLDPTTSTPTLNLLQHLAFPALGGLTSPRAITTGDFNFDCRDDIILANVDGENIAVYLSQGGGFFGDPILYKGETAFFRPGDVVGVAVSGHEEVWGLIDNPAGADALVLIEKPRETAFEGQAPSVLSGPFPTGTDPRSLVFGDLNDDGAPDLVFTNFADSTFEVRFGVGSNGDFGPPSTIGTVGGPRAVTLGDVDGDGDIDIVIASHRGATTVNDQISVHLNRLNEASAPAGGFDSIPEFQINLGGKDPAEIVLIDVNNDNIRDVVTVNQSSNNVSVLRGVGNGDFLAAQTFGVGNAPVGLAVVDLGVPEGFSGVSGMSTPALWLSPPTSEPSAGLPDIVVVNSADDTVTILYNGFAASGTGPTFTAGPGVFGAGETYPLGGRIAPNRELFDAGTGTGTELTRGRPNQAIEPVDVVVGDVNGDLLPDIVTLDQGTSTVTILHANTGNRVASPVDFGNFDRFETGDPTSLATSQGVTELTRTASGPFPPMPALTGVGFNTANPRKFFLPTDYRHKGSANEVGDPAVILPVGSDPRALRLADMNQDGLRDIVVGSFGASALTFHVSTGADRQAGLIFDDAQDPPVDPPFHPDVALGQGEGEFSTTFTNPVSGKPIAIDIDRVDRDCPPDVGIITDQNEVIIHKGQ